MTPRRALAQIRKLLRSRDRAGVVQGLALVEALDDPQVTETLVSGISLCEDRLWCAPGELAKRVRAEHRGWAVLRVARIAGLLDGLQALDLGHMKDRSDLSPLVGLTALRTLALPPLRYGVPRRSVDLASIGAIPGLKTLRLNHLGRGDLSPLAALTALTELEIEGEAARDLSPLAALSALQTLRLHYVAAADLSPLAQLPALRSLTLEDMQATDLSPLAELTGLERLRIRSLPLQDISPLAGLTGLTELAIQRCPGVRTLSPLAGLTGLTRLELQGTRIASVAPLRGLSGLVEGVEVDAQGRLARGESLEGEALYMALQVDGPHLADVRRVTLDGGAYDFLETTRWGPPATSAKQMRRLDWVARLPALEVLSIANAQALVDLSGLLALPALRELALADCPEVAPAPRRRSLETRSAVREYQRAIAADLERRSSRTKVQRALLEAARGNGVLAPPANAAARRSARRTATPIRKLLTSRDPEQFRQGLALLEALDDEHLLDELAGGVSLTEGGEIELSAGAKRRSHLRSRDTRIRNALALLRARGALDGVETLDLRRAEYVSDLGALDGLEDLRELWLPKPERGQRMPVELPGLKVVVTTWLGVDARALVGHPTLTTLRIRRAPEDFAPWWRFYGSACDLSPLAGATSMRELVLELGGGLMYAHFVGQMTGLRELSIEEADRLNHLQPLANLQDLERLSLSACPAIDDLSALAGLPALRELTITDCDGLPAAVQGLWLGRDAIEGAIRAGSQATG